MTRRVTIGLPFYNSQATLGAALRSVYAQTYQDWELILIDDGSTDQSLEIATAVSKHDSRVQVVSDKVRKRLPHRLNQIANLARGEFIARMDADDLMHPERIEEQVKFMDSHPAVEVVGTGTYTMDDFNNPVGMRWLQALDTRPKVVLRQGLLIHPTVMARRNWFQENPYNEDFWVTQDVELWCRTVTHTVFANIAKPLYFYHEGSSVTLKKYITGHTYLLRIYKLYGPSYIGLFSTYWLILRAYLKVLAYVGMSMLGLRDWLVKQRSVSLSIEQQNEASAVIKTIMNTDVPGLPVTYD